ncbi:MAG: hypothetical protein WC876_04540 [Candidatus Thermoplasmatota archaeon]
MIDFKSAIAPACLFLLILASSSSAEPGGLEGGPVPQGEPEILANETMAPPASWDDVVPWGGLAPPWFEDPESVDCGGRAACLGFMAEVLA